jgi:hypothetical protein
MRFWAEEVNDHDSVFEHFFSCLFLTVPFCVSVGKIPQSPVTDPLPMPVCAASLGDPDICVVGVGGAFRAEPQTLGFSAGTLSPVVLGAILDWTNRGHQIYPAWGWAFQRLIYGGVLPPPVGPVEFPEGNPIQQGQSHPEEASSAFHPSPAMLQVSAYAPQGWGLLRTRCKREPHSPAKWENRSWAGMLDNKTTVFINFSVIATQFLEIVIFFVSFPSKCPRQGS